MAKKVGLVSLGCPKNLLDSEVILGHMKGAGYELAQDPSEAEILIVNTCGFIEPAKQESINTILEMARYKEQGQCRRLVVTGCLAQRYADDIAREIPEVDTITGLDQVGSIVQSCETDERLVLPLVADGSVKYLYDHETPRVLATPPFSAYIKISEGCDYPCTFCIIPKIRGHYRSRNEESVIAEAESLASRGVKEILLIAQDTTRYGVDLGKRHGLASLLGRLAQVDGIEWVRFLYAYPSTLNVDVLEAINEHQEICKYIDIPLQHASDGVLKAMKRPGTRASNTKMIEKMRAMVPGVAIRSSFIVGFPGESEDDFGELLDFCGEIEFDHLGVFTYSHEEGTEAFCREDIIPEEEKQRRRGEIMERQAAISLRKNRALVGRTVRVLIEGPSPESELVLSGRTEKQVPEIDGTVLVTDGWAEPGHFAMVEITEAHPYDLVGTVVEPENPSR